MEGKNEPQVISSALLKQWAVRAGFAACGVAPARRLMEQELRFRESLGEGRQAEMHFLERDIVRRFNPEQLLPGCKSVMVVLYNYLIDEKPASDKYRTARYSWIEDYHSLLKRQLQQVADRVVEQCPGVQYRITVDSSCISEKNWAAEAGVGCFGKNGLIHNDDGSFFVIGALLLDCAVEKYDFFRKSDCGTCRICVEKCPAKALEHPFKVDARRCFAYHTIENKNPDIEILENAPLIYGCDICQEVCPKNKKNNQKHPSVSKTSLFLQLQNQGMENLTKEDFKTYFGDTSIARRRYERLKMAIEAKQNHQ